MPLSELKKALTKHDPKDVRDALENHVKGLYRSIQAKEMQIEDLKSQLKRDQEENDELHKAWTLASRNFSKFDSENSENV